MKVFLDTNVLLDSIVEREVRQFSEDAATILELGARGVLDLYMTILSVPTIAYVIKHVTAARKKAIIRDLTSIVHVLPALPEHVGEMLESPLDDLEDALQLRSAKQGRCALIITRNVADYRHADLPAITPQDLLDRVLE